MTHDLKTDPDKFKAIRAGAKRFELRKNDRNFATGDKLRLQEFIRSAARYTGNEVTVDVRYILQGDGSLGLAEGYVVMSISDPIPNQIP